MIANARHDRKRLLVRRFARPLDPRIAAREKISTRNCFAFFGYPKNVVINQKILRTTKPAFKITMKNKIKISSFIREKIGVRLLVFCLCAYALMLVCNLLTGLCVDDFSYFNDFSAKGEKIDSFWRIFSSLGAHMKIMNGRTTAHFFVHLFLYLPLPFFKLLNPAAFVLLLIMICKLSAIKGKINAILFAAVFAMIWIFTPAFGQTVLWLDGAINYLWGVVFGFLFIMPFVRYLLYGEKIKTVGGGILFAICGFIAGGYMENTSAAFILMAAILLISGAIIGKTRPAAAHYIAYAASLGGFLFMALAPAEQKNKLADMTPGVFRANFITALEQLKKLWLPVFILTALFVLAAYLKLKKETFFLAGTLAIGALAANFIMSFAQYYPDRAAFPVVILIISACAVLAGESALSEKCPKLALKTAVACLLVAFAYFLLIGVNDVYQTHLMQKSNIETISEYKSRGISDVELPLIRPGTKYSALYDLKYLDTSDSASWPNAGMAAYYGVNTIIGIP